MPLYVLACFDKPGALDLRMATREAHLAWARDRHGKIRMAGPMLSEEDAMAGSLFFLEAENRAEVEAFNAEDPYTQAGLWERVEIRRFRSTLGQSL